MKDKDFNIKFTIITLHFFMVYLFNTTISTLNVILDKTGLNTILAILRMFSVVFPLVLLISVLISIYFFVKDNTKATRLSLLYNVIMVILYIFIFTQYYEFIDFINR